MTPICSPAPLPKAECHLKPSAEHDGETRRQRPNFGGVRGASWPSTAGAVDAGTLSASGNEIDEMMARASG